MNNKAGLVPTPVVTKNGVSTTVYRKPAAASSAGTPIPAPAAPAAMGTVPTRDRMLAILTEDITETLAFDDDEQVRAVEEELESYPDELLSALHERISGTESSGYLLSALIGDGERVVAVREALAFQHCLKTHDSGVARTLLRSVHHYPQLPDTEDYSTASARVKEQVGALLTVAEMLDEDVSYNVTGSEMPVSYDYDQNSEDLILIRGDDLIDLIIDRPQDARRIGQLLTERRTDDAEFLESLLDSDARALSDGNL